MDITDLRQIHEGLVLLGHQAHVISRMAGYWDQDRGPEDILANVQEEVSSSLDALTSRKPDRKSQKIPSFTNVEEHLADAIICIADFSYANGLNVGAAVAAKMKYNEKLALLNKERLDEML